MTKQPSYYDTTSFEIIQRITGDKWKILIICHLFNRPYRFGELLYQVDNITKKVLTENLRELENLGIIERNSYSGNIAKVVYTISEIGRELQPILNELMVWGVHYADHHRNILTPPTSQNETDVK